MIGKLVTLLEDQIGKVRFVSIGVEDEGNAKLRYTYTSNQSKFYPESRDNDIEGERFEVRTFF